MDRPHIVIVGGGFGGLDAARRLARKPVRVTLIDRRNFHLFQPLLYQVATGGLSPGDIASPLRAILNGQKNTTVVQGEVVDLDPDSRALVLKDGERIEYDALIIATGATHSYFGNEAWAEHAPGLKTVEDALEIRTRILKAFENAERETDQDKRKAWMRFAIVGGGPTGVELAGAIAELAHHTLRHDFRRIDPVQTEVLLIEAADRLLPSYPESLSERARRSLEKLGVTVRTRCKAEDVRADGITISEPDGTESDISCGTILWAVGVAASPVGKRLADRTGCELDRSGRVIVKNDLTIGNHPDIFVVGDLACFKHQGDTPLPGVAPVAMQQGGYAADAAVRRLEGRDVKPFRYANRGSLAVIGRNAAVADLGWMRFGGFSAWLMWVFIHIGYLVGFDNKLLVMFQWGWNYVTRKRGARLITRE